MQNDQTTVTANDNEFDLDDLLLTAVQEQDIRAGRDLTSAPAPPQPCPGCGWGPPMTNHNETVAYDETELDELDDLLLTAAQERDIKAGRDYTVGPPPPCPGCTWGGPVTNHNETVAEDDATEAEALADLPVEETDQIKGGSSGGGGGAGKVHFSDLHFTTKV